MKRQVFKRGQKVFTCTVRAGKYNLATWIPAKVTNPEPKVCPSKTITYHVCYSSRCKPVPDSRFVDIVKLDREGKRITNGWGKRQVRNVRSVILSEEEAQPVLIEITARKVYQKRTTIKRGATVTVQHRMEKAAVPMAKALKRIAIGRFTSATGAASIAVEVLELLKVPKKNKAR